MAKGRKNGCPISIRDWLIEILDKATDTYVRIYGLNEMSRKTDSDTEDGSADYDVWEEPYVSKRKGSLSLSGKEKVEASTGKRDAGQELLNDYANQSGCDADATIRFTSPYGHRWLADYIVTSTELDANGDVSWELEQVGETEVEDFIAVGSVSLKSNNTAVTELSLKVGDAAKIITVVFSPETVSNKRFKVSNSAKSIATVGNITDEGFSITPVSAGSTTVKVTTVNGEKTASIAVTVTES